MEEAFAHELAKDVKLKGGGTAIDPDTGQPLKPAKAIAMSETTSTIKRASIHEHLKRKKFKMRRDADKITRLYALRKDSGVEFKHVGDIDGFIPNIEEGKYVDINGYGRFRVKSISTTFDIEMGFIIQSLLLKEE